MSNLLEFESSLRPLENEIEAARKRSNGHHAEQPGQLQGLEATLRERLQEIYRTLTPWQKVQVARHRERPYSLDYLQLAFADFVELRGDRRFADDHAIVGGPAILGRRSVMVIGHQKGRDTKDNVARNFGMPHPEGYRKAERLMRQAERMGLPVATFVDTPGANAALGDEERGQAEAIASSIATMLALRVPVVSVVIGEGGSGGALAIATADRILMLEHAIFTVASPEAAATILWRDAKRAPDAAENMKITAQDLLQFGLIDEIIPEPIGGAHRDHAGMAQAVESVLTGVMDELCSTPVNVLMERRYHKYRDINFVQE